MILTPVFIPLTEKWMKKKWKWLLLPLLLLMAVFVGVSMLPDQQSWNTFVRLNQAANAGDWQTVYDGLSQDTRQQFGQVGGMIRQYAQVLGIPQSALATDESMFVAALPQLDEMQASFYKGAFEVLDARRHGETALVDVLNLQNGQEQAVTLVREQGEWKLLVPLQETPE